MYTKLFGVVCESNCVIWTQLVCVVHMFTAGVCSMLTTGIRTLYYVTAETRGSPSS